MVNVQDKLQNSYITPVSRRAEKQLKFRMHSFNAYKASSPIGKVRKCLQKNVSRTSTATYPFLNIQTRL